MSASSPLDPHSREPLHEKVRRWLHDEIETGRFAPGDRLPTEREIAAQLNVSLAPVRMAMSQLALAGQVERLQGRGTFVTERKVQYALKLLASTTDSLRAADVEFSVLRATCATEPASDEVARALKLAPGTIVTRLDRTLSVRNRPAILLHSWLALFAADTAGLTAPDAATRFEAGQSLYARLAEAGLTLSFSEGQIEMIRADDELTDHLGLPFGHPLLRVDGLSYDANGRAVEYARSHYDAYRFSFRLERGRTLDDLK